MTTQRTWKTTIPDIGEITATMTTRQYSDGGRGYLFRFGGAVDDYGKTGFQPEITAAIDDYSYPDPTCEWTWTLCADDYSLDEEGVGDTIERAEADMMDAFARYFESDACADMIRGYVNANK